MKYTYFSQMAPLRDFWRSRFHLETYIAQTQPNETSYAQLQQIETLMFKVLPRDLYAQD